MSVDPEILALPVTLREAERLAREYCLVGGGGYPLVWERMLSERKRQAQIDAMAALLSEITRPESRDGWHRILRDHHQSKARGSAEWMICLYSAMMDGRDHPEAIRTLRDCILATFSEGPNG